MYHLHQSPPPSLQHGGRLAHWTIPEKIQTGGGGTLPLEIPDKTKLNPWKFHKIVLDHLEILRPKTKTPGNPALFDFVFN